MSKVDEVVEEEEKSTFLGRLVGQEPSKTPCLRKSFLTGISSGLGISFVAFLGTSNGLKALNLGFASYLGITIGTWIWCRNRYAEKKAEIDKLKKAVFKEHLDQELTQRLEVETDEV